MAIEAENLQVNVSVSGAGQANTALQGIANTSRITKGVIGRLSAALVQLSTVGFLRAAAGARRFRAVLLGLKNVISPKLIFGLVAALRVLSVWLAKAAQMASPLQTSLLNIRRQLGGIGQNLLAMVKRLKMAVKAFRQNIALSVKLRNSFRYLTAQLKLTNIQLSKVNQKLNKVKKGFGMGKKRSVGFMKAFKSLFGPLTTSMALFAGLAVALDLATLSFIPFTSSAFVVAGVLTLLVVATAALYAAWKTNFLGIRDITRKVMNKILMFWNNTIKPLINNARKMFKKLQNIIGGIMMFIYKNFIRDILREIKHVWNIHFGEIIKETRKNLKIVSKIISNVMGLVQRTIKKVMSGIMNVWRKYGGEIKTITKAYFDVIAGTIGTALDAILSITKASLILFTGDWKGAFNIVSDFVNRTINGIAHFLRNGGKRAINAAISLIVGAIKGIAGDAGIGLINGFISGFNSELDKAKREVGKFTNWIDRQFPGSDAKEGPLSTLTASGKALPATLAKGIEANIRPLSRASEQAALAAKPMINAPGTTLPDRISQQGGSSSSTVVIVNVDARGASDPKAVGTAVADELRSVIPR